VAESTPAEEHFKKGEAHISVFENPDATEESKPVFVTEALIHLLAAQAAATMELTTEVRKLREVVRKKERS
jgi:hypothetical protein